MEAVLASSDVAGLVVWQLKDSKARFDILLHCGKRQFILLCLFKTSKAIWDRIKQIYEKSNKASQVNLHQRLCRMTMSKSEDVITFSENW